MRDAVRAAFQAFSDPIEGTTDFMYLDNAEPKGLVTIGMGNLIDPVSMAIGLPFVHHDGSPATRSEILACWSTVKARQDLKQHGGGIYAGLAGNALRLPPEAVRNLVDRKLTWFDAELAALFPNWNDWCCDAQLFGLSWAWAVGTHARYPRMVYALNQGNFAIAVDECEIHPLRGTIVRRNAENRTLLRNAAKVHDYHLDPEKLYWPDVLGDLDTQPRDATPCPEKA